MIIEQQVAITSTHNLFDNESKAAMMITRVMNMKRQVNAINEAEVIPASHRAAALSDNKEIQNGD